MTRGLFLLGLCLLPAFTSGADDFADVGDESDPLERTLPRESFSGYKIKKTSYTGDPLWMQEADEELHHLQEPKDVRAFRKKHARALIFFHAPWCHHSRAFGLAINKVHNAVYGDVEMAAVNCEMKKSTCEAFNVDSMPTLHYYGPPAGSKRVVYRDGHPYARTTKGLLRWLNRRIEPDWEPDVIEDRPRRWGDRSGAVMFLDHDAFPLVRESKPPLLTFFDMSSRLDAASNATRQDFARLSEAFASTAVQFVSVDCNDDGHRECRRHRELRRSAPATTTKIGTNTGDDQGEDVKFPRLGFFPPSILSTSTTASDTAATPPPPTTTTTASHKNNHAELKAVLTKMKQQQKLAGPTSSSATSDNDDDGDDDDDDGDLPVIFLPAESDSSTWVSFMRDVGKAMEGDEVAAAKEQAAETAAAATSLTEADLRLMRVRALREVLASRGVDCRGCTEKSDFVARILETNNDKKEDHAGASNKTKKAKTKKKKKKKATKQAAAKKTPPASTKSKGQRKRRRLTVMQSRKRAEARAKADEGWDVPDEHIKHLTDDDIVDAEVPAAGAAPELPYLIMFYAQWCGHCQQLKPMYAAAAEHVKEHVRFAAVDCDLSPESCQLMGAQRYPTLKFFTSLASRKGVEHEGPRDPRALIFFARTAAKNATQAAASTTTAIETVATPMPGGVKNSKNVPCCPDVMPDYPLQCKVCGDEPREELLELDSE